MLVWSDPDGSVGTRVVLVYLFVFRIGRFEWSCGEVVARSRFDSIWVYCVLDTLRFAWNDLPLFTFSLALAFLVFLSRLPVPSISLTHLAYEGLQLPTTYLSSSSAGQPPSPTSAASPAPPSPTSPITPTHASPSNPRRSRLSTQFPQPTIVHLSIRPYAPPAEDEALIKKNLRAARRALSRSGSTVQPPVNGAPGAAGEEVGRGCCGCVIC